MKFLTVICVLVFFGQVQAS